MAVYVSSVPPQNPVDGDFWISQSTVPYQLFVYKNNVWNFVMLLNTFTEVDDITNLDYVMDGEVYLDKTNGKVYVGIAGNVQEIFSGA